MLPLTIRTDSKLYVSPWANSAGEALTRRSPLHRIRFYNHWLPSTSSRRLGRPPNPSGAPTCYAYCTGLSNPKYTWCQSYWQRPILNFFSGFVNGMWWQEDQGPWFWECNSINSQQEVQSSRHMPLKIIITSKIYNV